MKTLQQALDTIVTHARKQRALSITEDGSCCYRDENGRRCFVGALITDAAYDPELEQLSVEQPGPVRALAASEWPVDPKALRVYSALQRLHDDSVDLDDDDHEIDEDELLAEWEQGFANIAAAQGLTVLS
jgi:hypothetical protein